MVKPKHPLPRMRRWAISPDFAALMASWIRRVRPRLIVEVGSGVSTLIAAYCLQELGRGRIVSRESDADVAEVSRQNVEEHGLAASTRIVHAALLDVLT